MNNARADLRIDRARLANARPGDRERLASALAMASPAATGVSERGLLLVRKVRVDRPLGAGVEGFAGELVDRIRAAKVSARRGSLGAGDSVYFENEVALEVAIVGGWLAGESLPEMVRQMVRDSATPLLRWRRNILPNGRKLAAAIAALVEAGTAGQWLAHFDESELVAATELVVRTYGGTPVRAEPIVETLESTTRVAPGNPIADRPSALREAMASARAMAIPGAIRALLAAAIVATRRPALVTLPVFTEALGELALSEPVPLHRTASRGVVEPVSSIAEQVEPKARDRSGPRSDAPAINRRDPVAERPQSRRAEIVAEAAETRKLARAQTVAPPMTEVAPPLPAIASAVQSEHAGLFFLLNVFLALGLYGDFTDPARGLKGLSPFELMLLLGRRWLGPELDRDPIVPLLRSLAGLKPRERAGRSFDAPAWQVPSDWLAPWPDLPARFVGTSHWHRCGFPLADHWPGPRPASWMRRRWVACLARYIEARLARALGMDDRAEAVRTLIDLPGAIHVDSEHLEIRFSLDAHPLAIRLAGLDRDSGWIPAAGRTIGFRFT